MGEVAKYGFSPESFFKNIIYHNVELHKIVEDVEKGTADVGIMRLCAYEKAIEQGRIDPRKIVPAFTLEGEQTRCLHSTDLYPNWTLFAFPTITAQLASKITAALITMAPGNNHAEWVVPGEFNQLDNFLKRMNLGQFKELRSHYIKTFISKNLPWFLAGCALFILILSYSGILRYLVEKRTSQLKNSLKRQKSYFEKIIESEQKIQILQRRSAAGQLSNLISHELKQPLTTILCSAEVIDKKLDAFSDVDVSKDLDLITSEAIRATSIIDRVRDVAKGTKQPKEVVDFSALIKDTVEQYQRVTHGKADVQFNLVPGVFVRIVPIDWQLLILNLLKNAQENGFGCKNVLIVIKLIRKNESVCVLSIENSGNLSDQELDTINSLEPKSSTQGLGIGLVIVRDIAISSDALLKFSKSRLGGLCVSLELNYEIRKSHTDSPSCG